jgi:hypothetical protein
MKNEEREVGRIVGVERKSWGELIETLFWEEKQHYLVKRFPGFVCSSF